MAYRYHGRARISSSSPRAVGQCDRCGFVYNRDDLQAQMRYAGFGLVDTGLRVCPRCLLEPNPSLRSVAYPPDPVPVRDPRPVNIDGGLYDYLTTEDGDRITTEDGDNILAR